MRELPAGKATGQDENSQKVDKDSIGPGGRN